jgi:hypothetical protein
MDQQQQRRNRFQFRLRTLMLATACVFLATPWVAESWIRSYREQLIWGQYNAAIQSRDQSLAEWREASTNDRKMKAQEKFETTDAEMKKLVAKIKMFYDFDENPGGTITQNEHKLSAAIRKFKQ